MADPIDNSVPLEDLPLEERRLLPHNHPLLDAYATKVNAANGLPEHFLNALKNAGERSQSVGANSISPKGAQGVMQFMPNTAKEHGLSDRTDPMASIDAAGRMGAAMSKSLGTSDPALLAAAYNGGPNRDSLRAGQIPNIPETQAYSKRVLDYVNAQKPALANATNGSNFVPYTDLSPEDKAKENAKAKFLNSNSPLSDSAFENAAAGAGKAMVDTAKGLGQLGIAPINYISNKFGKGDLISKDKFSTDESDALDAALMHSKAGLAGNVLGNAALTAVPFGALSKLGAVKGAAQLLNKIPAVGGALSAMFPNMVAGSAISAAQPVSDDSGLGQRATNAALGAAVVPLAHGVGIGANALKNTGLGKNIASGAESLLNVPGKIASWIGEHTGVVNPSGYSKLTPTGQAAVDSAIANNVHVYPQQIVNPGKVALVPEQHAAQAKSFTRAVAKNDLGQDTSDLNKALQQADKQSNVDYAKVYTGEKIPIHGTVPELKGMQNSAFDSFDPRYKLPKSDMANDILQRAIESAEKKPVLTGEEMQKALSVNKGKIREIQKGDRNGFVDRSAIDTLHGINDTLTGASNKVLSPEKQQLLKDTNGRYRRMLELEPTLQNNALGNISPSAYADVIQKNYPKSFNFGRGGQERSDLSRYGSTFMTENPATENAGNQLLSNLVRHPITTAALGTGAGHLLDINNPDHTGGRHLGALGTGASLGLAASLLGKNPNPNSVRLLAQELEQKSGPLARMFRPGNLNSSMAQTINSQEAGNQAEQELPYPH